MKFVLRTLLVIVVVLIIVIGVGAVKVLGPRISGGTVETAYRSPISSHVCTPGPGKVPGEFDWLPVLSLAA